MNLKNNINGQIAQRMDLFKAVFKKYKLKLAPNAQSLEIGYRKYGTSFALDIAQILQQSPSNKTSAGFLFTRSTSAAYAGETPLVNNSPEDGSGGGGFWTFLTNLVNAGSDIYQDMLNKKYGSITNTQATGTPAAGGINTNTLLMVGMGLVLFILLLIIVLKK